MMMADYKLPVLNATEFDSSLKTAFQEQNLIFPSHMTPYMIPDGNESYTYDFIGESNAAKEVVERFGVTTYQDLDFRRRELERKKWDVDAIPVTEYQKRKIRFTPDQYYVQELSKKLRARMNKVFIDNFEAGVVEKADIASNGSTTSTTVSFDSNNIVRADSTTATPTTGADYSGSGTNLGLTYAKVQQVLELAESNKVLGDEFDFQADGGGGLCMLVTYQAINQLMEDVKASSKDYDHLFQYDNVRNRVASFRGIKFVYYSSNAQTFDDTVGNTDTIQKLYCWHPSAFIYDQGPIVTKVTNELPDRKYDGQVYAYGYHNVLRVREEAAFRVDIKVS